MSQVTILWSVINMTRVLSDGYVIKVSWACAASAPNVQGAVNSGQDAYTNNPDQPDFIPYDQLTQDIVLGWVWASMGSEEKATLEAKLTAKVEAQLSPATASGVPWNTNPVAQQT
jgi:hypothetical protein